MTDQRTIALGESGDQRVQRSRRALREALLELLGEMPFDQITITELTARAQIGYTTYFRHYPSKEALLNDVASVLIRDLLSLSVPVVSRAGSLQSCRALCHYVDERREIWRSLLTGGAASIVQAEFVDQAREWAPQFLWDHAWLPVDLGAVWTARSTIEILSWWLSDGDYMTVDDVAAIIERLSIRSIDMGNEGDTRAVRAPGASSRRGAKGA